MVATTRTGFVANARWKIFDINVLGAWLVETYKGNFASEINKTGVDGLIAKLADRNKQWPL